MSKKNTCILLYTRLQNLEQGINTLQTHNFDMKSVSILGKGQTHKILAAKSCMTDEQASFQGRSIRSKNGLWSKLNDADFFLLHDFGEVVAAGPIVHLLTKGHEDTEVICGLSVPGQALFSIGIPIDSIRQYEKSVHTGKFLLIIHGSHDDVERACQLLHSKTQQVTVHMA